MTVSNITFVMEPAAKERFLAWMRSAAVPALFNPESPARSPRLVTVVEAGGLKPDLDQGLSIALQSEFESPALLHSWEAEALPKVLAEYTALFGPNALYFATILETLPL